MVQVDVFWSYAIGAGFAVAAHRQLQASAPRRATFFGGMVDDPFLSATLLFLGLLFVPSGTWLVWGFTSWETMHAATDLPAWLVAAFAFTNVSQGVLGYLVARWLIARGRPGAAYLQFVLGYFAMFFVLVHGWDGMGYQRFFSASPSELDGWSWSTAGRWLSSDVALTLYGMGVVMLPIMLGWMARTTQRGMDARTGRLPSRGYLIAGILAVAFLGSLGSAIVASVLIHWLGWWIGLTLFGAVWIVMHRHGRGPLFALGRWAFGLDARAKAP